LKLLALFGKLETLFGGLLLNGTLLIFVVTDGLIANALAECGEDLIVDLVHSILITLKLFSSILQTLSLFLVIWSYTS
jgi:hypothetical protein